MSTNTDTWVDTIATVLAKQKESITASRIVEIIRDNKLRDLTRAKTPASSVHSRIGSRPEMFVREVLENGDTAFRLRRADEPYSEPVDDDASDAQPTSPQENKESFITYYGLMWPRKDDNLRRGVLQGLADDELVNLCGNRGIYILYMGETLVYIGRVTERALAKRLDEHTQDNVVHRWDRFSFFLFNSNDVNGVLVTKGIEALLLEALNPCCNRACGQLLGAVEVYPTS